MAADLPKEFDVIVLGTGMPESIMAAAFSRIGQTVLHLDRNDYYSGDWASFNLKSIEKWAQEHSVGVDDTASPDNCLTRPEDEGSHVEGGESLVQLPLYSRSFSQADMQFHVSDVDESASKSVEAGINQSLGKLSLAETEVRKECDDADSKNEHDELSTNVSSQSEVEGGSDSQHDVGNINTETCGSQDTTAVVGESLSRSTAESPGGQIPLEGSEMTDNSDKSLESNVVQGDAVVCDDIKGDSHDDGAEMKDKPDTSEKQSENDANGEAVQSGETLSSMEVKTELIWTVSKLREEWRKFNLDLSPKVLFSGGDMVELLISSDIAKYCEFKTVTRILTILNDKLEKVPCSRADVFSSKKVSMLEKRMLMKFLKFSVDYETKIKEIQDYLERPFTDFLVSLKMTPNIKHFVQHSIAFATDSTSTKQGLEQTQKFLLSLGRYGNTAFLWSLYGSGELPQSFCRMCAVFGGLYCLRMSASSLILDDNNKCKGVVTTEGQRINCKWLIMEHSYAPASFLSTHGQRCISRCILLTDKPLLPTDSQELSLMCLPCPDDGDRPILILELPPQSLSSPTGVYVYHLTRAGRPQHVTPQEDLAFAVDKLFCTNGEPSVEPESKSPCILWSLYFNQTDASHVTGSTSLPDNVIIMPGPGPEFDIDAPVLEARQVFKKILPEEEFLPKAPNPEDIIYVDDTEAQVNDGSGQSEFNGSDIDQSQTETKMDEDTDQSEFKAAETDQSQAETKVHEGSDQSDHKSSAIDQSQAKTKVEGDRDQSDYNSSPIDQSQAKTKVEDRDQSDYNSSAIDQSQAKTKVEEDRDQSDYHSSAIDQSQPGSKLDSDKDKSDGKGLQIDQSQSSESKTLQTEEEMTSDTAGTKSVQ